MSQTDLHTAAGEYFDAVRSARMAKTVFWMLVWVALVTQLVCFILVQFAGILDTPPPAGAAAGATRPATEPIGPTTRAVPSPPEPANTEIELRRRTIECLMPVAQVVGLGAAVLLSLSLLVTLLVALVGGLGGARGFTSSLFWSLLLLMLLVPWQHMFPDALASGVLTDLGRMQSAIEGVRPQYDAGKYFSYAMILHFIRFLVYPVIALLAWMVVGLRFARGLRRVNETVSSVQKEAR
jgi:hypothetical protein